MQDKFSRRNILLYLLGTIPVTWLALLIAPYLSGGLPGLLRNFGAIMEKPFHITFCEDSVRAVLIFLLVYGLGINGDKNFLFFICVIGTEKDIFWYTAIKRSRSHIA